MIHIQRKRRILRKSVVWNINTEKVVSLKPDLVLAHSSNMASNGGIEQLKKMGLTVLVVNDAQTLTKYMIQLE